MPDSAGIQMEGDWGNILKIVLNAAGSRGVAALKVACVNEADAIMTDAKMRCPVDTGTLRASGFVAPPEELGGQVVVEMGFGGAAQEYALVVHEDLTAVHPVGEAKFLENAFLARVPQIPRNVAARVGAALQELRR